MFTPALSSQDTDLCYTVKNYDFPLTLHIN